MTIPTDQFIIPHANRTDGYTIGQVTLQGVRAYDAAAGQFMTPDAYAGEVHDPMSQKPFMWNRNNPYQYSDPSGYASCSIAAPGPCIAAMIAVARSAGKSEAPSVSRVGAGAIAGAAGAGLGVVGLVVTMQSSAGNPGEDLGAWKSSFAKGLATSDRWFVSL